MIGLNEMIMALKRLKGEAACGPDLIHNLILQEGIVPKAWKSANITMISKKSCPTQAPSNYRPISITSCLGKLIARFMISWKNILC
ncbi:RNA-directed DNA polymerase from mobile element jockey-like [Brachionus plicatilis]|uniref:RNA-directed DNA polymerase from mobile element jockey-like n=1 Tax=Brachionus plicatilis TaxID=10195 RepID=A0A3M7P7P1_BRAPC|nr:RNA-directed DNA polymerase from mobile element jockey-like [Brachionus plicatilis]